MSLSSVNDSGSQVFGQSRTAESVGGDAFDYPPPLVVRKNGDIESLTVTGPALGFPHVAPMREGYAIFHPGDGLVLYTDGVTDVGPSPDEFFDVAGVQATIRSLWTGDR